jgi:formamidopyrimidine-DNA glycosylase
MPELPDVTVYVEHVARRTVREVLEGIRLGSPFVLRSVSPRPSEAEGRRVVGVERLGKRLVIRLEDELALVIHLMIAGRLAWHGVSDRPKLTAKNRLAAFDFSSGTLLLTEAGSKKRASLHVCAARRRSREHDRGGLEPLGCALEAFAAARRENHTLKRALTDPRLFAASATPTPTRSSTAPAVAAAVRPKNLDDEEIARPALAPRRRCSASGPRGCAPRPARASREGHRLPPGDGGARPLRQPCPAAARRCSASSTPRTSANYCAPARPAASCSPTARSRGCCAWTGRAQPRARRGAARSGEERNEPRNVRVSLTAISEIKGLGEQEVAEATAENARRLFGIGDP